VVDGVYTISHEAYGLSRTFCRAVEARPPPEGSSCLLSWGAAILLAEISGNPTAGDQDRSGSRVSLFRLRRHHHLSRGGETGTQGMPASELPQFTELMKGIHLLLPIPILIVLLPWISLLRGCFLYHLRNDRRELPPEGVRMAFSKIMTALSEGARASITVGSIVGFWDRDGACSLTGSSQLLQPICHLSLRRPPLTSDLSDHHRRSLHWDGTSTTPPM